MAGVFDIPAKNDILGMVSHRAKHACSRCLHPGTVLKTNKGYLLSEYTLACIGSFRVCMLLSLLGGVLRVYPHFLQWEEDEQTKTTVSGRGQRRTHAAMLANAKASLGDPDSQPVYM